MKRPSSWIIFLDNVGYGCVSCVKILYFYSLEEEMTQNSWKPRIISEISLSPPRDKDDDRTIVNFTASVRPVELGSETKVLVSIDSGAEINLFIDWGDDTSEEHYLEQSEDLHPSYNHTYALVGDHSITVRASNDKGSLVENLNAAVDTRILNVSYSLEHAEVGEGVRHTISAVEGSRISVFWNHGDGTMEEKYYENATMLPSDVPFIKTYNGTQPAVYSVSVHISNPLDLFTFEVEAAVNERIANLDVKINQPVSIRNPTVVFTQTITAGSHMTCGRYFGDDLLWIVQDDDPPLSVTYDHVYETVGAFDFVLRCYNYLDYFIFITQPMYVLYAIEDPYINLTNETLVKSPSGEDLSISFCFGNGTNVTCSVTFNGETDDDYLTYTSVETGPSCGSYNRTAERLDVGDHELNINCSNLLGEHEFPTILVKIMYVVTGLNVSNTPIYAEPNQNVEFWANITEGSLTTFYIDFGDDSLIHAEAKTNFEGPSEVHVVHSYSKFGYYTVTVTANNSVSSQQETLIAGIENGVSDTIVLSVMNVTSISEEVQFTMTHPKASIPNANATQAEWDYTNTGTPSFTEFMTIAHDMPYVHSYQPDAYGDFTACANVSNNVSAVTKCVAFRVGVPLEIFSCTNTNPPHTLGDAVTFLCQSYQGSTVQYKLDFGDIDIETVNRTETSWDLPDFTTVMHTYAEPGIYTVLFQAIGNAFVPLLEGTVDITILEPVGRVYLVCNQRFVTLGDSIECEVRVAVGSLVLSQVDFADDDTVTSFESHPQFDASIGGVQFEHTYTVKGNYSSYALSKNDVSSNQSVGIIVGGMTVEGIIVQESVGPLTLSADPNPVKIPDGAVIFTVETELNNYPTDLFCSYTFPDGETDSVYTPQLMTQNFVQHAHTFPLDFVGTHTVYVNCSNFVSHAASQVEVTLIQTIVNPSIEFIKENIKKEESAVILLSTERGSHHSFDVNYQDGNTETIIANGDSFLNGSIPVEVTHSFNNAFNYTITVRAFNDLSEVEVTAIQPIIVQEDLSAAAFVLSSDGPVGLPPGNVQYTLASNDVSSAYNNLWLEWQFGDGSVPEPQREYVPSITPDLSYVQTYQFTASDGGLVTTQVNVSNLVSFTILEVTVSILELIEGVSLAAVGNSNNAFTTGQNVLVNCSFEKGSQVEFKLQPGDESSELTSGNDASGKSHIFTHSYMLPKTYTALCTISNAVNSDSSQIYVIIQNLVDIDALEFEYAPHVKILYSTNKGSINLQISSGVDVPTGVQAIIDAGDESVIWEEEITSFPYTYSHEYEANTLDNPVMNVTLQNLVSTGTKVLEFEFQQEIVGPAVNAPTAIATGSPAYINITLEFGSHYTATVNFGDTSTTDMMNANPVYFMQAEHVYHNPGEYTVAVSVLNDVMNAAVEAPDQVITVQNVVPEIRISSETNVPITGGINFNLVVEKLHSTEISPTNAGITIHYGDSSAPETYDISLDSAFEQQHAFLETGVYTVDVIVFNEVSVQALSHVIIVEEEITDLAVQINDDNGKIFEDGDNIPMDNLISFTASYSAGTNVSLAWKISGVTIGSSLSVQHTFTIPGEVQVELTAMNGLGPVTPITMMLNIVSDTNIESFTYNTSIQMGNYVPFIVKLKEHTSEVCFELQANTSTSTLKNWFGPMTLLCQGRAGFEMSKFEGKSADINYGYSMQFDTVGLYSIVLTVITGYGSTVYHDLSLPLEVLSLPCDPPSLSLFDGSTGTRNTPLSYLKAEEINAPSSGYKLELNCEETQDVETTWQMFQVLEERELEVNPTNAPYSAQIYNDRLVFPERAVPYGLYRLVVKINMLGFPSKAAALEFYITVDKSNLITSLPSYKRLGHGNEFVITLQEAVRDADVPDTEDHIGLTYEWFCGLMPLTDGSCPIGVTSCEDGFTEGYLRSVNLAEIVNKSIPITEPEPFTEERVASFSGCFGDGPGRLDIYKQVELFYLSFNTGHMIPSSTYRVVLRVSKDTRETWNTMELEILPGNPPSFSIGCFNSVSGYSIFCRDTSNYISAKKPYYIVINCPDCPSDRTTFIVEVFIEEEDLVSRRKRGVSNSGSRNRRDVGITESVQQLDVDGYQVIYIPADTLPLGYKITVVVTSQIPGLVDGKESITMVTSGEPTLGTFDVEPKTGIELETLFDITQSDWKPYDSSTRLEYGYEACTVDATDDTPECNPILVPTQTTMIPGREKDGFQVEVYLIVSDEYSNVIRAGPILITVEKANDEDRENAIDSIDLNSNPTSTLNSLMTFSAGIDVSVSTSADDTSGGTSDGADGTDGGTDGGTGTSDGGTGTSGTGTSSGTNQGQTAAEKAEAEEAARKAAEELKKKQASLAKIMSRVNDLLNQNEKKVPLSPEVKLQALTAYSTLSKKITRDISVDAQLDSLKFVENLGDNMDLGALDTDSLEKAADNMLGVLGSVGRTMEQEVKVVVVVKVDPESIPDPELEDQQREEELKAQEKAKDNALQASKTIEDTANKIAQSGRDALILNAPVTKFGNAELEITMKKATADVLSNATFESPEFAVVMPFIPDTDEIIFIEMTYIGSNIFTFEESAAAVSTGVQQMKAVDAYDQPINMGISPENPFKMSHPSQEGADNWADMSNSTFDSLTRMVYFYVPVEVNNSAYISCLDSDDPLLYFQVYVKLDVASDSLLKPNQTEGEHDLTVRVPDHENPSTDSPNCLLIPQALINSPGFFVGLDILREDESSTGNDTVPRFKMNSVLSRCRSWDSEKLKWLSDTCKVGSRSTPGSTQCECSEVTPTMKSFAGGVTIPQVNSINFKNVFSNFLSLLAANPTVCATIGVIVGLYFLLVIWSRRSDKKDVEKWGVTPLVDNKNHQQYFYKLSIFTGLRKGAGTKSKVCFILSGEEGDTGIRIADDGNGKFYERGSVRHFVMSTDFDVGAPTFLRIWHDNSGESEFANWFLDKIVIEDLRTKNAYFFLCSRWLAADEDDGQVDRMIPVAGTEEIQGFSHLFFSKARKNLTDDHLWISLVSRPTKSHFTRVQRLTCCLSLLFTTMLANAMFFRNSAEQEEDADNPDTRIHLGPIILSANSILTSIFGSLVALPINIIIVQFFRKSKPQHWREEDEDELLQAKKQDKAATKSKIKDKKADVQTTQKKKKVRLWNMKYPLPRQCTYVAWGLAIISILVSAFFVILYSLEWGETKSLEWLSSLVFSFFQSIAVIQPVKIIVLAAALSLLFKTLDDLDDDHENKEVNAKPQPDELLDDPLIRLQQTPIAYIPKPPSKKKLEASKRARIFEKKMWSIVKEVIYYFLFLLLISFIAWGNKADIVYKMNEHIKEVINTGPIHGDNIRDGHALWKWLRNTAIPSIFYDKKYTAEPTTVRDRTFMSDMVSFRVGAVRLRQSRIGPALCDKPRAVEGIIVECNVEYSIGNEEDRNYTTGWYLDVNGSESNLQNDQMTNLQKSFKYFSMFDLKGLPYWGKMSTYGGGGYVADLGTSSYEAKKLIDSLIEHSWIDYYTRAVFLEFTVYNPGINLFAFVNYLMEFPAAGAVQPSDRITSFQVYSVVAGMGAAVVAAQLIYIAVLIYFIVKEVIKMKNEKNAYWKSAWNWVEFSLIVGSVVAIAMFVLREKFGRVVMSQLRKDTTQFTNYSALSLYNENIDYLVGFLVFLANIKFLKLLRFNKHVSEFSATITFAAKDLFHFAITFTILFTAFAIWGFVIFGKTLYTFSTFIYTLETMMSMLLGKFEFNNMEDSYKYLGKIYFISFTIFVFFIVINMLLGIITMAYEQARSVPQDPMAEYKVFGFLWKKIRRALHMKVKTEEHGEGYMSYTDTIDMRLSALDQHITHMYKDYLESKKSTESKAQKEEEERQYEKDLKARLKLKQKALQSTSRSKKRDVLQKY